MVVKRKDLSHHNQESNSGPSVHSLITTVTERYSKNNHRKF